MRKQTLQEKIRIIENKKIGERYFQLKFESQMIARSAQPGQFVELKVAEGDQPLLRRPLGVHSVKSGRFDVLCEIVGKGTGILSQRKEGDYIDAIGPLGNGFDMAAGKKVILIAGGMGVAPLLFLAERLKKQKPLVLLGARTKKGLLCEKEFKKLGCRVKLATDDGSAGFKGKITGLLEDVLACDEPVSQAVYACGPKPMLQEIARISLKLGVQAQVSLEEHLACGIGACLGCVVETKSGLKRVCKEGPVFRAEEVVW